MTKNVVVTVDDYLMRKDPEKYKKMLEPKEEETIEAKAEDDTEKREMLAEVQELGTKLEAAEIEIRASYAKNVELGKKIKKLEAENKKLKKRK